MKKKVIITGITGQDGSYMIDFLLENTNFDIVGVCRRLSVANHKNIAHLDATSRVKLRFVDITDQIAVTKLIKEEKPDFLIHFAANSYVGDSWNTPINHIDTNIKPVVYILEAIKDYAPKCRAYFSGSSEEFGDVKYSPQDEKHPLNPRSPYGASKCAGRHFVKVYRESYNLFAIQGVLFNHESPRRGQDFVTQKISKGLVEIVNKIEKKQPFKPLEIGNALAYRDWSHAKDFVEGIWMMLNHSKPVEYVLSSNETHSVKEFIENTLRYILYDSSEEKLQNAEVHYYNIDNPEKFSVTLSFKDGKTTYNEVEIIKVNEKFFRPAEVDLLHGDSSKIRGELGWKPRQDFDSLVADMAIANIKALKNE